MRRRDVLDVLEGTNPVDGNQKSQGKQPLVGWWLKPCEIVGRTTFTSTGELIPDF